MLLREAENLDIVFLDIVMPNIDGIEVGRQIRRRNSECKIIIASGKTERFKEAFQICAFRFITKPFDEEEIRETIQAYSNEKLEMKTINLYRNRNLYKVLQSDIWYICAYDSYTEYFVENKKFRQTYSLNQLEEILDQNCFYRACRQYIVNLYWIQDYKNGIINMGICQISVSRRKRKEFEKNI